MMRVVTAFVVFALGCALAKQQFMHADVTVSELDDITMVLPFHILMMNHRFKLVVKSWTEHEPGEVSE